jgi:hypothetical protein
LCSYACQQLKGKNSKILDILISHYDIDVGMLHQLVYELQYIINYIVVLFCLPTEKKYIHIVSQRQTATRRKKTPVYARI